MADPAEVAAFTTAEHFCLFAGQPRSGHSVLGTLLNAHRHALVSHNLDVLWYLRRGFRRPELFHLILERDRWLAARERRIGGYRYDVPGQWLGRWETLRLVGDKRAGSTSRQLHREPGLLRRLADEVALPVVVIHYLRNPWDNIASIWNAPAIRRGRSLPEVADWYFEMFGAAASGAAGGDPRLTMTVVHHEDLVRDPAAVISALLGRFGLATDADYLAACRRFVHPEPRRTRTTVPWTPALIDSVRVRAAAFPVLGRYTFAEQSPVTRTQAPP